MPYCVCGWVQRWHWICRLSNLVTVYLFVYTLTLADVRLCVWQLQQYQLRGFPNQHELLNYNNRTLTIRASDSESLRFVLNHRNNRVLYWNVKQISLLTCIANMNLAFFRSFSLMKQTFGFIIPLLNLWSSAWRCDGSESFHKIKIKYYNNLSLKLLSIMFYTY